MEKEESKKLPCNLLQRKKPPKKKRNEPKRFAFTEEPQHYGLHAKVSEMLCKRICHWLCKSTTQLNKGLRF